MRIAHWPQVYRMPDIDLYVVYGEITEEKMHIMAQGRLVTEQIKLRERAVAKEESGLAKAAEAEKQRQSAQGSKGAKQGSAKPKKGAK